MDAMGIPALSHSMSCAATQAMFYLVTGSHRIQLLHEMEVIIVVYVVHETKYNHQISELEKDAHSFDQKYDFLASEKNIVEEVCASLEAKVDSLVQANEELMIQNESLERDVVDRDKLIGIGSCRWDSFVLWIKFIGHPDFTNTISRIRYVAFVAGEESGRAELKT